MMYGHPYTVFLCVDVLVWLRQQERMGNLRILKYGCKEACVHPYSHSLRVDNLERMRAENSKGKTKKKKKSPV